MVNSSDHSDLFFRWLLIVYIPLGLLGIQLALLPFGLLPSWTRWTLPLLAAYSLVAVRLLVERKRSGLGIPLPRRILVSVGLLLGMAVAGVGLFVAGMGRLTTSGGLAMVFFGGCLMILTVAVPAFRLLDIVLRKTGRLFGRLMKRPASKNVPQAPSHIRRPQGRTAVSRPRPGRPVARRRPGAAASARRAPDRRPSGAPAQKAGGGSALPRRPSAVGRLVAQARRSRTAGPHRARRAPQTPATPLVVRPARPPER